MLMTLLRPLNQSFNMKTIEEQIFEHVQSTPDKIAFISGEIEVSYARFWEYCLKAAASMKDKFNLQKEIELSFLLRVISSLHMYILVFILQVESVCR